MSISDKVAVSLTMKQTDQFGKLDEFEARKNLGHFSNRLNKLVFRNAFTRHKRKLEIIPILEKSLSGRLHYHLALQNPFGDVPKFHASIKKCWQKTRWGYDEIDVQEIYSYGWIDYITKAPTIDGWDVENTYFVR